jgi:hypothetical protein
MRPWVVALLSAAVALAIDAAWLWVAFSAAPKTEWETIALTEASLLVIAFLATYAAFALALTTAARVLDLARIRSRLARLRTPPTVNGWTAAFAGTGLARLAHRTLDLSTLDSASPGTELVLQSRFEPDMARREVLHLYRGGLLRAQFVTALALLLAVLGLGLAEDYVHLPLFGIDFPAWAAGAAFLALGGLAAGGGLVIEAAAEPLLDVLTQLPVARLELRLLRSLAGLGKRYGVDLRAGAAPALSTPLVERLVLLLEQGRNMLPEAIIRLSASFEAMTAASRAMSDHAVEFGRSSANPGNIAELQSAIAQLAAAIERLATVQIPTIEPQLPLTSGGERLVPLRAETRENISHELRRVMAEFE